MNIPPNIKPILYALTAFLIFMAFSVILKLITNRHSSEDIYFNIVSNKDLLIGAGVALIVTLSNERRKKLKN